MRTVEPRSIPVAFGSKSVAVEGVRADGKWSVELVLDVLSGHGAWCWRAQFDPGDGLLC